MKKLLTIALLFFSVQTFAQFAGGSNWYIDRFYTKNFPFADIVTMESIPRYYHEGITAPAGNNSGTLATTAYVDRAVSMNMTRMITLSQYFGSGTTTLTFPHGLTGIDSGFNVVATARAYHYEDVRYIGVDANNFYVYLESASIGETFSFSFAFSPSGSGL